MKTDIAAVGLIAVLVAVLVSGLVAYQHGTGFEDVICVADKYQRGGAGDSGISMMVATEDGRTMKVADAITHLHFRSADVYSTLREGSCYAVTGFGWRVGLLSMFPVIVTARETTDEQD